MGPGTWSTKLFTRRAIALMSPGVIEDLVVSEDVPDGAAELTELLTPPLPLALDIPLGRPLSLISGTKEVGVLDDCVSGSDGDTPDKTVLEV